MFEFVENHRTAITVVLGLVGVSLLGFGAANYQDNSATGETLAKVGSQKLTLGQFQQAMQNQQLSEDKRPFLLDNFIRLMTLREYAKQVGIVVTDAQVKQAILSNQDFIGDDGKFSTEVYQKFLANNQLTAPQYEKILREDLASSYIQQVTFANNFDSVAFNQQLFAKLVRQRQYQESEVDLAPYLAKVQITPAQIKQYYDKNIADFKLPAQARVEYVSFSKAALAESMQVSDAEAKAYFDKNKDSLVKEERRASHILIRADKDAKPNDKAAAKAKASALLAQLRKDPSQFAALAQANSADGSAAKGGDLDFAAKGAYVPEFEAALFALKNKNDISEVVETQFGYHIIQLTDMRLPDFTQLKLQAIEAVRKEKADKQFVSTLDKMRELVVSKPTLQEAAKAVNVPVMQSEWLVQKPTDKLKIKEVVLNNPKVLDAIFSAESLKRKQSTTPVDVGNQTFVSARVITEKPAMTTSLKDATEAITQILKQEAAIKLADADIKAKIAAMQASKDESAFVWGPLKASNYIDLQGLGKETAKTLFALNSKSLPAYASGKTEDGKYMVYKLIKVEDPVVPEAQRKESLQQLSNAYLGNLAQAYFVNIENLYPAKIKKGEVRKSVADEANTP